MNTAHFSPCRTWRYTLTRDVAPLTGYGTCVFIGLNPSTADETQDDPTIRRCIGFAQRWGYARLKMMNLYAYRSTDPKGLWTADDPVGPVNNHALYAAFGSANMIVAAWGVNARPDRLAQFTEAFHGWDMHCLGVTKNGSPRHPLYVKGDTPLVPFPLVSG